MGNSIIRIILKNKLLFALIIFLIVYIGFLLLVAKNRILSEDESYTLYTTSSNLRFAIKESYNFEAQPPVYFGLLNLWRNISDSLFFARVFSVFFILLSGIIVYKTSRFFLNNETSILGTVLFLLNPYIVGQSFNTRLFALLVFFSALSLYFYYKAYLTEYPAKIHIISHAIISLLGIFTQYLFVFLLIAQFITLLITKKRKKIQVFFAIHLFIAMIFIVNFLFIPTQMEIQRIPAGVNISYYKSYFATIQNFLLPFNLLKLSTFIKLSIILLYVIWLLIFFKMQKFSLSNTYKIFSPAFFLLTITFIIFLSIIFLFTTAKLFYSARYMTILFPSLFLFFIFSLTIYDRKYFLFCFMFISVYYLIVDIKNYSNVVNTLDYKEIVKYIENNVKSDTPLLFYRNGNALPFQYYYSGKNKIVQIPVTFRYIAGPNYPHVIKDTMTLNKIFKKDLKNYKEFIYLSDMDNKIYNQVMNYEMVAKYLSKDFFIPLDTVIMGRSKTLGLRVRKLIRKEFP